MSQQQRTNAFVNTAQRRASGGARKSRSLSAGEGIIENSDDEESTDGQPLTRSGGAAGGGVVTLGGNSDSRSRTLTRSEHVTGPNSRTSTSPHHMRGGSAIAPGGGSVVSGVSHTSNNSAVSSTIRLQHQLHARSTSAGNLTSDNSIVANSHHNQHT